MGAKNWTGDTISNITIDSNYCIWNQFTSRIDFRIYCHVETRETMTQTVYVRFSYENRVSEEVPIHTSMDLTKNSNRKKLLNRLIKQNQNITEVTLL